MKSLLLDVEKNQKQLENVNSKANFERFKTGRFKLTRFYFKICKGMIIINLFKPNFYFEKVNDINPKFLKELKIKTILLDVDNTLTPPNSNVLFEGVKIWLENLKNEGFKIIIVSNNDEKRVSSFAKIVNLPYIFHAHKPLPFKIKKYLKGKTENIVVVGDQILTDILLANLASFKSVLVEPQSEDPDRFSFKLKRSFEKYLMRKENKKWEK